MAGLSIPTNLIPGRCGTEMGEHRALGRRLLGSRRPPRVLSGILVVIARCSTPAAWTARRCLRSPSRVPMMQSANQRQFDHLPHRGRFNCSRF